MILPFQLTGERKSLSKKDVQSQVPSLKVWCNFGMERVWSRNCRMKFSHLCCAEFIARGISLGITFNQQEFFNPLLSSLAAHGQVFGVWPWLQTVTTRCNPAVCSCWGGWQSWFLLPRQVTSCLWPHWEHSQQEARKKYCQFKVCMLPSFYMVESCEKDLWLEIYIFKSGYKLGDVVLQDDWSRAVLLRAGITPSSNQAAQASVHI